MSARDQAKRIVPSRLRAGLRRSLVRYGEATSRHRPLPDFLIIGTKRGGTTSLWRYLLDHPLVPRLFPAWNTKSTHYFEENHGRGEAWYRSHFPTTRQRAALQRRFGAPTRVGEAAPLYMFHPLAARRVAELMPDVRVIVLLRDPVERAYSHWKERHTEGREPLGFAAALAAEEQRTAGQRQRMIDDPGYFSTSYDWHSYRARGRYLEHLEPWLEHVDSARMLITASETFYRDPATVYAEVLDFLDLPRHRPAGFKVYNDRQGAPMDPAVRRELTAHFRPHNAALEQRLGRTFNWG